MVTGYPPGYKRGGRGTQWICSGDACAARERQPGRRALGRGYGYITGAHLWRPSYYLRFCSLALDIGKWTKLPVDRWVGLIGPDFFEMFLTTTIQILFFS